MPLPTGLQDFTLKDRRALIIGAEHPLGRVAAVTMAEAGAQVMIASQSAGTEDALAQTARFVVDRGQPEPVARVQQASSRTQVKATIDLAVERLGGLDVLITALDRPFYAPFEASDDAAFARVIDENLRSVWIALQEGGRALLERGGGAIVNISSVVAERGVPNATLYCAAQGAVRNLIRALALEWARRSVRINTIECGWLDEPNRAETQSNEFSEKLVKYLPYRRLVKPEEIAGALLYLVSPAASFVTGEAIAIDGGLLCRV